MKDRAKQAMTDADGILTLSSSGPAPVGHAHTGSHSWHSASAFGRSVSNGCVRVPRDGQRTLLDHIGPGTPVIVLE